MLSGSPTGKSAVDDLTQFILANSALELEEIIKQPHECRHFGLEVKYGSHAVSAKQSSLLSLLNRHALFALRLFKEPSKGMAIIEEAIQNAQRRIANGMMDPAAKLKPSIHVRLTGIPMCSGTFHNRIPGVEVMERLIMVRGNVTRLGPVRMRDRNKVFECSKCKMRVNVVADDRQYGAIVKPSFCTNAIDDDRCGSTKFDAVESSSSKALQVSVGETV